MDSQLTPEQQAAALDYGQILPTAQDVVKQQLARAAALRGKQSQVPAYGFGAGLMGGLANGINGLVGGLAENKLLQSQQSLAERGAGDVAAASPFQQQQVTPDWGMDLTQPGPESQQQVTPDWGMDLTQPGPGDTARAAGRMAGLSPERVNAALGPNFPGAPWGL